MNREYCYTCIQFYFYFILNILIVRLTRYYTSTIKLILFDYDNNIRK